MLLLPLRRQAWNATPWSAVKVDLVEEGSKARLKEVRALPRDVKDTGGRGFGAEVFLGSCHGGCMARCPH